MFAAQLLLMFVAIYAAIGLLFAAIFVLRGIGRVDHSAKDSSWPFRLLIAPGCAALWPLMAVKWQKARNDQ